MELKLKNKLTPAQRGQIEAQLQSLASSEETLNATAEEHQSITTKKEKAEADLQEMERSGGTSIEKATQINSLRTQIGLFETSLEKGLNTYQAKLGKCGAVVLSSVELITELCKPLEGQLREQFRTAIAPFCNDPEFSLHGMVHNGQVDAVSALNFFLHQSVRNIGREIDSAAFDADLLSTLLDDWRPKLQALLDNEVVWTFTPALPRRRPNPAPLYPEYNDHSARMSLADPNNR